MKKQIGSCNVKLEGIMRYEKYISGYAFLPLPVPRYKFYMITANILLNQ